MSYKIQLLSKARLELLEAWIWYEDRQPGLGERFKEEVFKGIHLIEQYPERYPLRKKPYYEKSIKVFPYLAIYRINKTTKTISIISIFHAKTNPSEKYK